MSTFELEVWDDETEKVTFYTVRWQDSETSETDKFFNKYDKIDRLATQQLLSLLIDAIGTDHGAVGDFFNRPEDGITGLPPKGKITVDEVNFHFPQFPLRLYALRILDREDIVVLFNGGIKSGRTNSESDDLNLRFIEAKAFGKKIELAIYNKEILIDAESRALKSFEGSSLIVL